MIALIDNYDSFAHNLARYLRRLGQEVCVLRNDEVTAADVAGLQPAAVVISPGPGTPAEAGCSVDVVKILGRTTPLLGVCLGHQAIAAAYGGQIVRAPAPWHGRTSPIRHDGTGLLAGLPDPLTVCRYHSLIVACPAIPAALDVTSVTDDGIVMSLAGRTDPVYGVQFHPEAILTDGGYRLLANFLGLAGLAVDVDVEALELSEGRSSPPPVFPLPARPVTF